MRLIPIEYLKCIRWYLSKHPPPDKILVCVDYAYEYIMHCRKDDWPCPLIRINTYEDNWAEKLAAALPQLTPDSLIIANEEFHPLIVVDQRRIQGAITATIYNASTPIPATPATIRPVGPQQIPTASAAAVPAPSSAPKTNLHT